MGQSGCFAPYLLCFGEIMGQLIQRNEIQKTINELHTHGLKTVTTNGCFDVLHVGHLRYLKASKSFGDKLIVLLNSDCSVRAIKGENRPINTELERAELLCALNCVDYVVLFDENSPRNLLDEIKPNIHTKGADYTLETLPEADVILKNGGQVEFIEFVDGKSTTSILKAQELGR